MLEHGGDLQCLATKKAEMWQQREQVLRREQVDQSQDHQVTKNEQGAQACSRCNHPQRWSNVHVVEVVVRMCGGTNSGDSDVVGGS